MKIRGAAYFVAFVCFASWLPATSFGQINTSIKNISPTNSDRDGTNPNSASGGRVNKLASHPTNDQVYFAATEWAGLFETADRGRTWTYVSTHVPQVTWDVKFHPTDTTLLLATSFFDGKTSPLSGLNISRDGGRTWTKPPSARAQAANCMQLEAADEPAAFGIAFDREHQDHIYVGTNCGLAISNDRGITWRFVDSTPGDGGGVNVYSVILHNNGIIDICGDDGHQRSRDGGNTFAAGANEPAGMCSLAVSPDEADTLFMSVSTEIFESRDGGASWPTSFQNPGPQGRIPFVKVNDRSGTAFDLWYGDEQLFRAQCSTPSIASPVTQRCPSSAIWKNSQMGAHWDVGDVAFDPNDGQDACPVIYSNDGGVYFNERTGADCHDPRWEQPQRSVTALWLWDMDGNTRLSPGEEGVYIGQQDSGGFGTREGAGSTPQWRSPACCDVFDVEAEDNRVVYTLCCRSSGRNTRMYLSDSQMAGGTEINKYPAGDLVSFRDTDSVSNFGPNSYALATSSGIFFTTDISATPVDWRKLGASPPLGVCGVYSSIRSDGQLVFTARAGDCSVGQTGQLWQLVGARSTGTWTLLKRNGNSKFGVFGVNPRDSNHIVANDMSGLTPIMVSTVDGGTTWIPLPALNAMLSGNGDFVLQTRLGTRPGDLPYAQASLVAINPANRNMLVAGGHDSGVFISLDGALTWELITDPRTNSALKPHISRPLFAHFETISNEQWNIYIGARGRGAWRITIDPPDTAASSVSNN